MFDIEHRGGSVVRRSVEADRLRFGAKQGTVDPFEGLNSERRLRHGGHGRTLRILVLVRARVYRA